MNIPENLQYTKEHEWILIEEDIATIGITDFAQSELGDIVFVDIETEGENLKVDDIFGTVEAVKTVSDLFMPLDGEVLEVNPNMTDAPDTVNTDPYGEGWMVRVRIAENADLDSLLDAQAYQDLIA